MNRCLALTVLLTAAALAGCAPGRWAEPATGSPTPRSTAVVEYRDYQRSYFGGWVDLDKDSCNTREEILARDSGTTCPPRAPQVTITDPYTGEKVTGRSEIDIDHVVPLSWAWEAGAYAWTRGERAAFANDPANLLATSDDVNRDKSDKTPGEWRPEDPGGWCPCADTYWSVSQHWHLTVTPTQEHALGELCPGGAS